MIRKALLYITALLILPVFAHGQEAVTGIPSNILLTSRDLQGEDAKSINNDTLELPFLDDFSGAAIVPDSKKWSDSRVFINDTYSNRQITTGIATFDALAEDGRLYESASSVVFEADHLTSRPINLDYPASANIWLSFHYQPGGIADLPEQNDSLTLQFFAPAENKWYSIWKASGSSYPDFRAVAIRVDRPEFLKTGFRFRFINYASLSANLTDPSISGNCDHWNIDYILLDKNRNEGDTIYADVAFRYAGRSMLNTYEAMPWNQYIKIYTSEMGDSISIHYRNNDIIPRNVTRNFEIYDVYNNKVSQTFSAGATVVAPLTSVDYNASHFYTFTDNSDSALFRVKSWLITDNFDPKQNDTIIYYQRFGNYFAFDDGSAEGGYGINGLGSRNAMVAFRFRSFIDDTLRAISICFNDSYMNSNIRSFDLLVWDNVDGLPGNILYSLEEVLVKQGSGVNGFHTYTLPAAVPVNGIFYIGWRQRSETFLNAGIDLNTLHGGKQLYWISGNWNVSQVKGTLMIRPVLGASLNTSVYDSYLRRSRLNIWPNPAGDFIMAEQEGLQHPGSATITIYDLQGRKMISVPFRDRIDISSLREGLYIVTSERNGIPEGYSRLIKTR